MDEQKVAEEKVVTETTENSPVSKPEVDQVQNQPEEKVTENPNSEVKQDSTLEIKESEKRQTRSERRINQLLGKLKDSQKQNERNPLTEFYLKNDEPLIKPEEAELGIDPNELGKRFEAKRLQDREQIKLELRAEQEFKEAVKDQLSDVESTLKMPELDPDSDKYDHDLDELVAKQYDLINKDMYGNFVPRVKLSEIYSGVKKILDKKVTSAQADVSAKLVEQKNDAAVKPSSKGESAKDYEAENLYAEAVETGSDEKWAEVLKRRFKS